MMAIKGLFSRMASQVADRNGLELRVEPSGHDGYH